MYLRIIVRTFLPALAGYFIGWQVGYGRGSRTGVIIGFGRGVGSTLNAQALQRQRQREEAASRSLSSSFWPCVLQGCGAAAMTCPVCKTAARPHCTSPTCSWVICHCCSSQQLAENGRSFVTREPPTVVDRDGRRIPHTFY